MEFIHIHSLKGNKKYFSGLILIYVEKNMNLSFQYVVIFLLNVDKCSPFLNNCLYCDLI